MPSLYAAAREVQYERARAGPCCRLAGRHRHLAAFPLFSEAPPRSSRGSRAKAQHRPTSTRSANVDREKDSCLQAKSEERAYCRGCSGSLRSSCKRCPGRCVVCSHVRLPPGGTRGTQGAGGGQVRLPEQTQQRTRRNSCRTHHSTSGMMGASSSSLLLEAAGSAVTTSAAPAAGSATGSATTAVGSSPVIRRTTRAAKAAGSATS